MPKRSILLDEIPQTLKEVSSRISALTEALDKKRDRSGLSSAEDRDWDHLLDYWHHVELQDGSRMSDETPHNDPFTLLGIAEKFNLAAPEQIEKLRTQFMKEARKIMGHDVTPAQVRKMYKLMRTFDPTGSS